MSDSDACVKCLVWDLDGTLWEGVLLEDAGVTLRPGVRQIVDTLDQRGILQSVASRNDPVLAMQRLREFGLAEYFLYPQIAWCSKPESVRTIAQSLNVGLDAIAFIDDQRIERDEMAFSLPEVVCIDAAHLSDVLGMPILNPTCITADAQRRRQMYLSDIARKEAEQQFEGPNEAFLASLGMVLTLFPAGRNDLQRARELTVRTHQLNSTGVTYSCEELDQLRRSDRHVVLMAKLEDRYGSDDHVGLALLEQETDAWTIQLLLTSCRVMSRGVGAMMLAHILDRARSANVGVRAHFMPNERNRIMLLTYRFAGFRETGREGPIVLLEHDLAEVPKIPDYVRLVVTG